MNEIPDINTLMSSLTKESIAHNMRFYENSRSVPKEAQKNFNTGRFSGTDINPQWRIMKLTEMFGPVGIGWYAEPLSLRSEQPNDDTIIALVDINLYVKVDGEWSKPIFGTGGNIIMSKNNKGFIVVSDEGYKMAYTDAISVACKELGIGADIYFAECKTKYSKYADTAADEENKAKTASNGNMKNVSTVTTESDSSEKKPVSSSVNDTTANGCISTEDLIAFASPKIRELTDKKRKLELAEGVKEINGGNANYKSIEDPHVRQKVYEYFVKFFS